MDTVARTFSRHHREELDMALSAIDCVLLGKKAIYASSELTTGRRYFELLVEHHVSSREELKEKLGPDAYHRLLWDPNMTAAADYARRIRAAWPDRLVISPAPFAATGWSQREYLALWETLLTTRVDTVCFNEGWQFSDGCTLEYAVALEQRLPTFDVHLRPLEPAAARRLIRSAIEDLEAVRLPTRGIAENLRRAERALDKA